MAVPELEVRIDWRAVGFSTITNDGFETNTTGWVVTAGINAAATSLTRITTDAYVGSACAELVTTATSGSGTNFDFGTTTFTSGRTYRFRVYLKSVSGTTSARILIGSLGTPADRASWTGTITTSWAVYSVDWTPSANRTDAEAVVSNNAASIMTARIDHAEVYETIQDVTSFVVSAMWRRGLSSITGQSDAGSASLVLRNSDNRFDVGYASGPYGTNVKVGREIWVRSTYAGTTVGHFHGRTTSIQLRGADRMAEIEAADLFDRLAMTETSVAASVSRDVSTFRGLVLDDAGLPAAQRDLDTSDPETMVGLTEADQDSALGVLEALNEATGTVHFVRPSASASVLSQYVTIARPELATGATVQALDGADVGVPDARWDIEDVVNVMKVTPVQRGLASSATVWTHGRLPFTVTAGSSRTLWARFDDPVFSQSLSYTATNSPTVNLTAYSRSAKLVVTAGGSDATVSALSVDGQAYEAEAQDAAEVRDAASEATYTIRLRASRNRTWMRQMRAMEPSTVKLFGRREAEVTSDYIPSTAHAAGLASWWVYRYAEPPARLSVTVGADDYATQRNRELRQRVSLTTTRLSQSTTKYLVAALSQTVRGGGDWTTIYDLETAPASNVWFTLGGTADEGVGGTGILAY